MELDGAGAARRMMTRLDELAAFTDEPGKLTRPPKNFVARIRSSWESFCSGKISTRWSSQAW